MLESVHGYAAWIQDVPAFLEEAGSASGFGLELRLSKRVVRIQSWGWLGTRQKHWAEEELASGRVQGWDYTVCEKSRNKQWACEGSQVNKVRTAQQFRCKNLPQYFCWWVIAGSSLMFNWSEGKPLANKSKPVPAGLREEKEIKNRDPDTCPRELYKLQYQESRRSSAPHNSIRRRVCHVPGADKSHWKDSISQLSDAQRSWGWF